jgi:pimeloyl-ACP methyl ester carboxylesterase
MQVLFWKPWGPSMWNMYAATLWPGLGEKVKERAAESTKLATRPGRWPALQKSLAGCDHRVVTPWLSKVASKPALVVMGDKDPDFSKPEDEANWIASNFSDHEVVMLPGVGHAPQYERPEATAEAALKFLGRLRSSGAFGASSSS